jgi:LPXTG-motif cell wall-anchored protein
MSNKKIGIIVGIVVAVVLIGFGALFFFRKRNNYRLLKIYEFDGDGSVTRDKKGSITPYTNMVLESGDNIKLNTGKMSLMADEDKFIYLDEGTEIDLVAKGNSKNSKTS